MTMNDEAAPRVAPSVLSGMLWALVWMAGGALTVSLLLTFTGQSESSLPSAAYIIHALSVMAGGWTAGKKAGARGWYAGGTTGLVYGILIYVAAFLAFDQGLHWTILAFLGGSFLTGAIGGMLGVNLRK